MEAQTLEELKRENAEAETKANDPPQGDDAEIEEEAGEVETDDTEPDADLEGEPDDTKLESWQEGDDQGSQDGDQQTVPVAAHARMRGKLKGAIREQDTEIAKLKAENEALRSGVQQPKQEVGTGLPPRPKAEDFDDDDQHNKALDDWYDQRMDAKVEFSHRARQQKGQVRERQNQLQQNVDGHYDRAAVLAEKSGITPEIYQAADLTFRGVIEGVFPKQGDVMADQLIARLGDGSEKVTYYLGRNKKAQEELRNALLSDPSGLEAAMYLAGKKAVLAAPGRRVSKTPSPAPSASGDAVVVPAGAKKLQDAYKKAHKSGNNQAAYNARKAARKQGVDVSNW